MSYRKGLDQDLSSVERKIQKYPLLTKQFIKFHTDEECEHAMKLQTRRMNSPVLNPGVLKCTKCHKALSLTRKFEAYEYYVCPKCKKRYKRNVFKLEIEEVTS